MRVKFKTTLPVSAIEAFDWHTRPGAFERLIPPWQSVQVISRTGGIEDGATLTLRVPLCGPIAQRWVMRHEGAARGIRFCDVMEQGPFKHWRHVHHFSPVNEIASELSDEIEFKLPLHPIGTMLGAGYVWSRIKPAFRYRHLLLVEDLARHKQFSDRPRLTVAISGASGLVGSALAAFLTTGGHRVLRLVRSAASAPDEIFWDPERGEVQRDKLEGIDAVVHLAGESIAARRWSSAQKTRLKQSRVAGTALIADTIGRLKSPPQVLVSASAIGFYGDRGEADLTEESAPGSGFLAEICTEWEQQAQRVSACGVRAVSLRIGTVLSPAGGALGKMLLPFRLGLGGPIGSGRQTISWIGLHDLVYLIHECLMRSEYSGAINATSPNPVSNREFGRTLGAVLRRPAILPLPAFVVKLLFGEMGEALLLSSAKVYPARASALGFRWSQPELAGCISLMTGRT